MLRAHTRAKAMLLGAAMLPALAACGSGPTARVTTNSNDRLQSTRAAGNPENVGPFGGGSWWDSDMRGGAVVDEPRAALVARDVLALGGNAADAAVAAYFTLAVTLPSAAGLGGGGVCLVHDAEKETTEVFDFLPRAAKGGLVAVPGNVRGMAAVNARYGRLPWAQLVNPGANLAGTGTAISRALANELQAAGSRLGEDPQMAAIFTKDGQPRGETDNLRQTDLGAALERIRIGGVNEFYSGPLGRNLADAAQSIGAPLTIEDLRASKTVVYPPASIEVGSQELFFPAPPSSGGTLAAQMIVALDDIDADNPAEVAKAVNGLIADRQGWMKPGGDATKAVGDVTTADHVGAALNARLDAPGAAMQENPSATGIVTMDSDGQGVACEFTMNAPFGSARIAPGTGIILAPAPNDKGAGFSALGPIMQASNSSGRLYFLAAGGGGVPADIAKALLFHSVTSQDEGIEKAMADGRLFADGAGTVYLEGALAGAQAAVSGAGFKVEHADKLARVNAIWCPKSTPSSPDTCQLKNDFRGSGLTTIVNNQ
ncbi:gamma-glutamyltransferase [Dongia sp.]|uniref:gamma-glutamyltransferase n=1 Tax=Dongia sp. TaxID=1977262 RepID=UPI0037505F20